KSSLFNFVLGEREAIVANEPGTTRDSIFGKATYDTKDFWLVDTAGLKTAEDEFEFTIQEQIAQAADSADVIVVMIEAHAIIGEEDRRVATMALKTRKPVVLAVNKADQVKKPSIDDYRKLGVKDIYLTSVTQGKGIEELFEHVAGLLSQAHIHEADDRIRLAILGRPNVGKSHLFNTLAKK